MPIYEYRCQECGKIFESIQKFSDEAFTECGQSRVECPNTGHGKVERLLNTPALQFKGSGFYITDYAKSGSASSKKDSAPAKSESKSETKSETKSESTAPKKDS